jgi:hypothetical protein
VVYFVFHGINSSNGLSLPTVHRKSLPFTVSTLPDSGFSIIHNVTHKISLSGFISFYLKMNENTVNRETPRTPRQHRVGDLGGTRREPTAHDGSRTKYRAGSTGRYESTSKGSTLVSSRGGIKTPCFETICFINLPPNHKSC